MGHGDRDEMKEEAKKLGAIVQSDRVFILIITHTEFLFYRNTIPTANPFVLFCFLIIL